MLLSQDGLWTSSGKTIQIQLISNSNSKTLLALVPLAGFIPSPGPHSSLLQCFMGDSDLFKFSSLFHFLAFLPSMVAGKAFKDDMQGQRTKHYVHYLPNETPMLTEISQLQVPSLIISLCYCLCRVLHIRANFLHVLRFTPTVQNHAGRQVYIELRSRFTYIDMILIMDMNMMAMLGFNDFFEQFFSYDRMIKHTCLIEKKKEFGTRVLIYFVFS